MLKNWLTKTDNSYAAFDYRPSSTWLTAYVVKVFAMAHDFADIDNNVLCGAVNWLISQKQLSKGQFDETAPVIHQEMVGGNTGQASEADSSLTAFVLIAMLESQKSCTQNLNNLQDGITKALSFLLGQYPALSKPYSVAISSYALALAGKLQDTNRLMSAATDKIQWLEPSSRLISLEATSYALLALLKMKQYDLTGSIVRWINEQRFYGEVYGSTQATIVMFQGLAQYQTDIPTVNELNMDVSLYLPDRQQPLTFHIGPDNALLAQSAEIKMNKDFVIQAKGKGHGTLRVISVYYVLLKDQERKCNNFDVLVTVKEEKDVLGPEGTKATVSIEVCARHLKNVDATMSIIDISMMTGFSPDVESLDKLKDKGNTNISSYEINKAANEKGTLIIYLDKISHTQYDCVKFYAHQFFEVGLIQPASVTVYDYYTPESRCNKFYHVVEGSALLDKICQGEACSCAKRDCFKQQQVDSKITSATRRQMACAPGVDYVYKVTLTAIEQGANYDNYVMTIIWVIKEGKCIAVFISTALLLVCEIPKFSPFVFPRK
ncbi:hypothetical protein GDO86_007006 [Hymenochirus boettgeri]|uniref:Alpha-macroglobulin receptor-binding domain-containing protein n=1 Tax=Hymenochirus boettgeri TaxID=247094 RepID=A0A8T2JD35_9PIPI|nr:hypothetical protein GDO86_007006 [Hymenochirus boettgeri]